MYESYTDLVPAAWTPVRIVLSGTRAELYVNGTAQPCLIVNDLKLGETQGADRPVDWSRDGSLLLQRRREKSAGK